MGFTINFMTNDVQKFKWPYLLQNATKTCDPIFVKTCFNYFSVVRGHLKFSSMKGKCFKNCNVWSYDD